MICSSDEKFNFVGIYYFSLVALRLDVMMISFLQLIFHFLWYFLIYKKVRSYLLFKSYAVTFMLLTSCMFRGFGSGNGGTVHCVQFQPT